LYPKINGIKDVDWGGLENTTAAPRRNLRKK
jgi:hypothetical protein